ncbi:MAG: TIGR00282 family metallophosphoesterase [Armatimonadota bacterium]|nr:TIGR00282 family metallophosphoesterase [Armatimonadota bacterium]MCX7776480.1 TIGR00282 family metallophosphoesterase [Armatimonadota bacterium]MDW8024277.1 TIGR00282 family metallophosphoesterase [Armatimonadota bacterium]
MRILCVGDVVGQVGRRVIKRLLPTLIKVKNVDFVIANGENAAGGLGITPQVADELFNAGVNCITTGNHIWRHKEIIERVAKDARLLRPANYPPDTVGCGWTILRPNRRVKTERAVCVVCMLGLIFMEALDCPFRTIDRILEEVNDLTNVIVVDFHAEATSEKQAFARYVDGRVSLVFGTHTHVMTADECILPNGTAYITDVGMTGPIDSVIGMKAEAIIHRLVTKLPVKFEPASGRGMLSAVLVDVDDSTGKARSIERISVQEPEMVE